MQHFRKGRTFGRRAGQRTALLRGLAVSLIRDEKMTTTEAKAKELRPFIERLITHAKTGSLTARRVVLSRLGGETTAAKKLTETIAPKYTERAGGYTRIIKMAPRQNDGARLARIEFV